MTTLPPPRRSGHSVAVVVASKTDQSGRCPDSGPDSTGLVTHTFPSASEALRNAVALRAQVSSARVGVHVGETTGDDDGALAPVVDIARHLCQLAEDGQILATRLVGALAASSGGFRLRQLGSLALTGDLTVDACEVLSGPPTTGLALATALEPGPGSFFVGRDEDLGRLLDAWKGAAGGQPRGVLVSGDAGIGKTRLAAELAAGVHEGGGHVLYGDCDEDPGIASRPFIAALRPLLASRSIERLEAVEGIANIVPLSPELGRRLSRQPARPQAEPGLERYHTFEAVVRLLGSLEAPVLMVVDDLHWAAAPTLLLLRHLLRTSEPLPLLVVGTYRHREVDRHHPLAEAMSVIRKEGRLDRIHLEGLDEETSIRFVRASAGHELDERATAFARMLHDWTGGSPLFMREILNHLTDAGTIYQQNGQWTADAGATIADLALPESVRSVIASRLAHLTEPTRQLLRVGALAGQVFSLEVLEQTAGRPHDPDGVLRSVDEALTAGVLVEPGPGQLSFAHALYRQELDLELATKDRLEIHQALGQALEALPDAATETETLAYHFSESAEISGIQKAVDYGVASARAAMRRFAYEVAAEQAERTLAVLDKSSVPVPARRAELLLLLAEAHSLTGEVARMKRAARRAAHEARRAGDNELLAQAAIQYCRWVELHAPDPVAVALCTEALDALGDSNPGLRARVLASLANHRAFAEGQVQAMGTLAGEALALARQAEDIDAIAPALFLKAFSTVGTPQVRERMALAGELVELGQRHDHKRAQLDGLLLRAGAQLELGDREAFRADMAELARLGEEQQWWIARYWAEAFELADTIIAGRLDEAERLAGAMLEARGDDPNARIGYASHLFWIRWEQGRLGELLAHLEELTTANPAISGFRAALALACVEAGDPDEARVHLERLTSGGLAGLPKDQNWMGTLILLAETAVQLDDVALASQVRDLLDPFEGLVAVSAVHLYLGSVDRRLGMLERTLGDQAEAERHFRAALALEQRLGAAGAVVRTRACQAQ